MANQLTYEELKQRVKKLEESERELVYRNKQLDSLVNNSGFGVVSVDKNMRIVGCNEAFEGLFLYGQNEMEGKTLDELIVDGDQIEVASAYTTTTLTGGNIQGSGQRRRKDGALIDVKFSGVPITVDGEVIGAYGVYEDITALRQAEEALLQSEEKFRDLFDNAPLGYLEYDQDGRIILVNQTNLDMLGYKREEIVGKFIWELYVEKAEAREQTLGKLAGRLPPGRGFMRTYRRKDESILPVLVEDRLLWDDRQQIAGIRCTFQDIMDRNQAEEALRESEKKYRQLFETAMVGIYRTGIEDGKFLVANESLARMLGYESVDALVEEYITSEHYADPKRRQELLNLLLTYGKVDGFEIEMKRVDGSHIQIAMSATIYPEHGYLEGVIIDITERKQAEEKLRKSEKRMKGIFESIPSPIIVYNTEGHPLYLNPAFTALFHWSLEELKGRRIQFVPDDQKELTARKIGEVYKTGKVVRYETKRLTKQGDVVDVIVSGAFVAGPDGEPVEMVAILTDITVLKQAEEALRESEQKYRTVLESNPDPVVFYDMEGRVIYLNPAFTRVFGWSLEERIGKKMDGFVPEENIPETLGMIKKVTVSGESFSGIETRRYTKEGDILDISISGSSYRDREGNVVASVINLRDITEQKRLEDQLQHSQKMEAIGTLAGGVAHDLNNILGGLVSYPELLLLQLPLDSPLRKSILTIQKSGEKAAAVVQDLLTLARRGVVVSEVVKLNNVIAEYLKSPELENLKSYHPGVHIETRLEKDVLNILGSSTHLSKTIMNLTSNAAEAMPEGGTLTVSTESRYIDRPIRGYDDVKEGDYMVLTVSDTGTGIDPDDIGKIFEPFYTKKKMGRSGTGLGMAVVWGTVKDHNGYIHVESTEGKGTTFTLYFPVTRKSIEERSEISLKDYMGKGETILVVDDVEEQRNIAFGMLKELGYLVASVSSGEEAIEYLKSQEVDLLVLDMIMDPGLDGLDTYKKILEIHHGQKAIIASGFSETDRVKEAQSLGAITYVRKPFLLEKIGLAVKEELEK